MRRLMKCGVSAAVVMTGAVLLSFSGTARADLAVTSTCAQVPLASEYDRAAAAGASRPRSSAPQAAADGEVAGGCGCVRRGWLRCE